MAGFGNFLRSERGSSFESLALALSIIAVMFVAGADVLNHASQKDGFLARVLASHGFGELTETARAAPASSPRAGVDYTQTGSIIGLRHPPTLDPCTGTVKN